MRYYILRKINISSRRNWSEVSYLTPGYKHLLYIKKSAGDSQLMKELIAW